MIRLILRPAYWALTLVAAVIVVSGVIIWSVAMLINYLSSND